MFTAIVSVRNPFPPMIDVGSRKATVTFIGPRWCGKPAVVGSEITHMLNIYLLMPLVPHT